MPQQRDIDSPEKLEKSDSSIASAASNLWQEAYENPGKAALVVGGAAAAIGIAYAARGQKGILLVEDTPYMGKAFRELLQEQGESVTWLTQIKRLQPFTGITNEGKEVVVQPHKFKFAFVDGGLKGSIPQGEHVVDALKSYGLKSFGTSTDDVVNKAMLRNGAIVAAQKPAVLTALVDQSIDFGKVTRVPAQVQREMYSLTDQLRTPELIPAYKKADEMLMKFMLE
jgi:hypothetical protein